MRGGIINEKSFVWTPQPTPEEIRADLARPSYHGVDEYAAAFPEMLRYSDHYNKTHQDHLFFPTNQEVYRIYPGGYLSACIISMRHTPAHLASMSEGCRKRAIERDAQVDPSRAWQVSVNDGDDGYCRREFATEEEAKAGLAEIEALAPVTMHELVSMFNYQWD